jgi:hypothetical protein
MRDMMAANVPQRMHERIGPWLKLANLLPPPPSRYEQRFPVLAPIERWRAQCRAISTAEFVHRFMRSGLAQAPVITATVDLQLLLNDRDQARRFLDLVGEIASALQTLVVAASSKILKALGEEPVLIKRLYDAPATSWSEISMCKGAVTTQWVDPFKDFLSALDGVEAVRVRQCPMCSPFFYALRKDQKACSKRCNAATSRS